MDSPPAEPNPLRAESLRLRVAVACQTRGDPLPESGPEPFAGKPTGANHLLGGSPPSGPVDGTARGRRAPTASLFFFFLFLALQQRQRHADREPEEPGGSGGCRWHRPNIFSGERDTGGMGEEDSTGAGLHAGHLRVGPVRRRPPEGAANPPGSSRYVLSPDMAATGNLKPRRIPALRQSDNTLLKSFPRLSSPWATLQKKNFRHLSLPPHTYPDNSITSHVDRENRRIPRG